MIPMLQLDMLWRHAISDQQQKPSDAWVMLRGFGRYEKLVQQHRYDHEQVPTCCGSFIARGTSCPYLAFRHDTLLAATSDIGPHHNQRHTLACNLFQFRPFQFSFKRDDGCVSETLDMHFCAKIPIASGTDEASLHDSSCPVAGCRMWLLA